MCSSACPQAGEGLGGAADRLPDSDPSADRRSPSGQALALESGRAEAMAQSLLASMDAGDGWTWRDHGHLWWYPSRLAVELTYADEGDEPAVVRADMQVVTGGSATPELLRWLNDLNAQAARLVVVGNLGR